MFNIWVFYAKFVLKIAASSVRIGQFVCYAIHKLVFSYSHSLLVHLVMQMFSGALQWH